MSALAEIVAFHEAVGRWFGASPAESDYDRMAGVLDPTFRRIGPDGSLKDRGAILAMLRTVRGCHAAASPAFAVTIKAPEILWTEGPRILTLYVEAQSWAGNLTRRRALAAFRTSPTAPCGVLWTELAETWIPH